MRKQFYFLCSLVCCLFFELKAQSDTYYVSALGGGDGSSSGTPWDLDDLNAASLSAGDTVLFNAGDSIKGMLIINSSGSQGNPIVFGRYGTGADPVLDGNGYTAAVYVKNSEYLEFEDFHVTNSAIDTLMSSTGFGFEDPIKTRYGFYFHNPTWTQKDTLKYIRMRNLTFRDIYPTDTLTDDDANGEIGSALFSPWDNQNFHDVIIENCYFTRTARHALVPRNFDSLIIRNCVFEHTGGSGVVLGINCNNVLVEHNLMDHTGSSIDPRMAGRGSGLWTFKSKNVIVQYNKFLHARGKNDSFGAHIDFGNENVIYQYNYSEDSEGGFAEILGDNKNVGYRYNISVSDGWRTRNDKAGKIIWISDYAGTGTKTGSDSVFIYNNTIYVNPLDTPQVYIDEEVTNAFIYNNIIHSPSQFGSVIIKNDPSENNVDYNIWYGPIPSLDNNGNFYKGDSTSVVNPLLYSPGTTDSTGYFLTNYSLALSVGKNMYNIFPDHRLEDYFGNSISSLARPNIGAYEGAGVARSITDSIEAESATLIGELDTLSCGGYSGSKAIAKTTTDEGIQFDLIVDEEGFYDVTLYYLAVSDTTLTYSLNRGDSIEIGLVKQAGYCSGAGEVLESTIVMHLYEGYNSLLIYDAPIIDKMKIEISDEGSVGSWIEAEWGTKVGSVSPSYCSHASGDSTVNYIDTSDSNTLLFEEIAIPQSSIYELSLIYATNINRMVVYKINDGERDTAQVLSSGGWCGGGYLDTATFLVQLKGGYNSIDFIYAPVLDKIILSSVNSGLYEAEMANLKGSVSVAECDSASNSLFVNSITGGIGNAVEFSDVVVTESGEYDLTISYLSVNANTMEFGLNGVFQTLDLPPAASHWCAQGGSPGDTTLTVHLNRGYNSVYIYNSPILDKIETQPAAGGAGSRMANESFTQSLHLMDESEIALYPNSIGLGSSFMLELPEKVRQDVSGVVVLDGSGRKLIDQPYDGLDQMSISTQGFASGMHFVMIKVGRKTVMKRLLIE